MRVSIIITCIVLFSLRISAQWYELMELNTDGVSGNVVTIGSSNFISESCGVHIVDSWLSPSSGESIVLKATSDYGQTWSIVWGESGGGMSGPPAYCNGLYSNWKENFFYCVTIIDKYKSLDNGNTWQSLSYWPIGGFRDFYPVSSQKFYMLHQEKYIGTNLPDSAIINKDSVGIKIYFKTNIANEWVNKLVFPSDSIAYIASSTSNYSPSQYIYKSSNAGYDFTKVFSDNSINITSLYFLSDTIGFAIAEDGKAIKTSDGGVNWDYLSINTSNDLIGVYFINNFEGLIVSRTGQVFKTFDVGETWTLTKNAALLDFEECYFVNDSTIYGRSGDKIYANRSNIGTKEIEIENILNVFPNPFKDKVEINFPKSKQVNIVSVYDFKGKLVFSEEYNNHQSIEINLKNLKSGVYFLKLINEEGSEVRKILKL